MWLGVWSSRCWHEVRPRTEFTGSGTGIRGVNGCFLLDGVGGTSVPSPNRSNWIGPVGELISPFHGEVPCEIARDWLVAKFRAIPSERIVDCTSCRSLRPSRLCGANLFRSELGKEV